MPVLNSLPTFTKRFPHYWVGAFLRYDTLRGAVFEDSPLVRQEYYWTRGFRLCLDDPPLLDDRSKCLTDARRIRSGA